MDGVVTAGILRCVMPQAGEAAIARYADPIAACMQRCGIVTRLRQAHFLAQVAHESGELAFAEELASGAAYEGRSDLGNCEPGDGPRFKGRGLLQITGRANYEAFGHALGQNLLTDAAASRVATDPNLAAQSAGWFWAVRGLNRLADHDDLEAVTRAINGGLNGLAQRRVFLQRARVALAAGAPSGTLPSVLGMAAAASL